MRSGFAGRISHGPFTLSLSLGLITQTGALRQVLAWLGLDDVRATAPVLIGDTIRPEAELALARPTSKPDRGVWALTYRVLNQRGESVMTFTSSFLVRRRPATPSPRPKAAARKNGLPSGGGQAGPDAPAP